MGESENQERFMADSHAVFGTEPNCYRYIFRQSTFPKDVHAEAQSTHRHSPPPPRALRLCVIIGYSADIILRPPVAREGLRIVHVSP